MNCYEVLQDRAHNEGLIVKEKPLQANDGLIKGDRIAIRVGLETTHKRCVLAEELGHHYTSIGNILNQSDSENRKQERRARVWAYDSIIGLQGIIKAYESGCRNQTEAAEYLEVTEEFLQNAIDCYQEKYGVATRIGQYVVSFIPILGVKRIEVDTYDDNFKHI